MTLVAIRFVCAITSQQIVAQICQSNGSNLCLEKVHSNGRRIGIMNIDEV